MDRPCTLSYNHGYTVGVSLLFSVIIIRLNQILILAFKTIKLFFLDIAMNSEPVRLLLFMYKM